MIKKIESDITKTGPVGYKALQVQNNASFKEDEVDKFIREGRERIRAIASQSNPYRDMRQLVQSPLANTSVPWGASMFDNQTANQADFENLGDVRAENQPWYAKLGAGITKGVALAGTTFIDGTVGLLTGIGEGIYAASQGKDAVEVISKLWDNEVSNGMTAVNEALEEILPNYRTQAEIEGPWYKNLGINFWADSIIKNLGFTVGALYSGAAWTKALKAANLIKGSMGVKVVGSALSAVNEGRIEANHGVHDFSKLQFAQTVDALITQGNEDARLLKENGYSDEEVLDVLSKQDSNIARVTEDIRDRANVMGLTTLIGNSVLLSLNNFDTFGKLYSRGFKNARTVAKGRVTREAAEEAVEGAGKRISRTDGGYGYKKVSKKRAIARGIRHGLVEGNEELAQAFISETAGQMQSPDSPDAYYKALLDPKAEIRTKDFLKAATEGFANTYGNGDRWEEFAVGAFTGLFGIPTFGKVQNSDVNTWLGKGRTVGISGGLLGELRVANKENAEGEEAVNFMNDYAKKVQDQVGHFVRSQSFTNAMDGWAEENDAFEYKNAEDNNDFSAISRFAKVGRLGDLKEMVNQDFENISDEELQKIAEFTTPQDSQGGWRAADGSLMSETEEGRAQMREELIKKRDKILSEIDKYEKAVEIVRAIGNNSLTEDQVNELAWLNWKVGMFTDRYKDIKADNDKVLAAIQKSIQAFQNGRGLGSIDEESEEGQKLLQAMDNTKMFIDSLRASETPLQLGAILEANPHLINFLEDWAYPILEDIIGIDAATFEQAIVDLKDTARIAKTTRAFNQRYKEFRANPINLIKNRQNIAKKEEKNVQASDNVALMDKVNNANVSDIVQSVENGNLDLKDLEDLFSEDASNIAEEDAERSTPAGNQKVEEAKKIIQTHNRLNEALADLQSADETIDLQAIQDARILLQRSKEVSESESEMLDTNTQAYNDPSLLYGDDLSGQEFSQEEIAEVLEERVDAAKSIVEQVKAMIKEQDLQLSKLPTGELVGRLGKEALNNTPQNTETDSPTNNTSSSVTDTIGHDATSKVTTENERSKELALKKAEEEERKAQQKKIDEFFSEARQEAPEGTKGAFDLRLSEVVSYIDTLLDKGASIPTLLATVKDTDSYTVISKLVPTIDEYLEVYVTAKTKKNDPKTIENQPLEDKEEPIIKTPLIPEEVVRKQTTKQLEEGPNEKDLSPTYQYWKPTISYLAFGKLYQKGNTTPFYTMAKDLKNANGTPMFTEAQLKRIEAVGKYLEEHGTFRLIDSGGVKVGEEVSFVIDSALNDTAGETVILMADSQGRIIGDVMSPNDPTFQKQAYLPAFVEKVTQEYKDAGSPSYFKSSLTTVVDKNMVGKVPYLADSKKMSSLNDIHSDGNTPIPFLIGIAASSGAYSRILASPGRTKEPGQSALERSINPPLTAIAGQPFLLVPTSSAVNHYMPVPFTNVAYNPSLRGTALGQAIHKVLERVPTSDNSNAIDIIRDLEDLISVKEIHINYSGDKVKVTIKPNKAENQMTIYNGDKNAPNIVEQLELGLQGQPFQISRKYMNGKYKDGQDYNRMVGEVAMTNLPIGATHTVSDWFTLKPIDDAGNTLPAKSPRSTGKKSPSRATTEPYTDRTPPIRITQDGKNFVVDPLLWSVSWSSDEGIDPDKINLDALRAKAFGIYTNKNLEQPYDTEWGYYDPTKDEFVSKPDRALRGTDEQQDTLSVLLDWAEGRISYEDTTAKLKGTEYVKERKGSKALGASDSIDFTNRVEEELGEYVKNKYPFLEIKNVTMRTGFSTYGGDKKLYVIIDAEGNEYGSPSHVLRSLANNPDGNLATTIKKLSSLQTGTHPETPAQLEEKAKKAGLLGNKVRQALWQALSPEQQATIANKKGPKQKQWMDALEAAFNSTTNTFDEAKLKGTVDEFLGRKALYRETDKTKEAYEPWNKERETQWLAKVLPNLSNEEHLAIVNGYIRVADSKNPGYAYGKFQEGMITISDLAARGTMYHEAFHAVTHTLLNDEEYQKLFDAAVGRWGDLDGVTLEEKLAEDFRRFMQSEEDWYESLNKKGYGIIRKTLATLYHKLQNLIKELSGKTPYLNKVYYSINRGKFSRRKVGESDITTTNDIRYKTAPTTEYTIAGVQSIADNRVNNPMVNKTRKGKNTAWGDLTDSFRREGYLVKGYWNPKTSKWTVASVKRIGTDSNQEAHYRRVEQYHRDKLLYDNLSQENKEYLQERGITAEEFKDMTQLEKEVLFNCKY